MPDITAVIEGTYRDIDKKSGVCLSDIAVVLCRKGRYIICEESIGICISHRGLRELREKKLSISMQPLKVREKPQKQCQHSKIGGTKYF